MAREKFDRMLQLAQIMPAARAGVTRDLRSEGFERPRVLAGAFRMLDAALLRVGSEQYAREHGSIGLATLRGAHAHVSGNRTVELAFPAKSGQAWESKVDDPDLAVLIAGLKHRGPRALLLSWRDADAVWHPLRAADINEDIRARTGGDFTAKDFRTLHGTASAALALARIGPRPTASARRRAVAAAIRRTAEALGNTPAVARSGYIDPRILDLYDDGIVVDARRGVEPQLVELLGCAGRRRAPRRRLISPATGPPARRAQEHDGGVTDDILSSLTRQPAAQFVEVGEGVALAAYSWGDLDAPTVVLVHGFASSTADTWVHTGWTRMLEKEGYRILGIDLRGHGASQKPHDGAGYAVKSLAHDVEAVMETFLVDEAFYVGYSLGARVGWQLLQDLGDRIPRAVLGGVPDGIPLDEFADEQVYRYADDGVPVTDPGTKAYVDLAERVSGNDLRALVALAEGQRNSPAISADHAPQQPVLFATGSEDPVVDGSRKVASYAPQGTFFEIPGRHHFNAPGSRDFRQAALQFLRA
jgi:pimeloyl-ACP methyl ester carboxylesterase